jgi:type IV pilus assembly protein PilE
MAAARGFSLVEVLVALAVIGVLAGIALPAYREQVARGHRAAAQTALLEDAQSMQRFYAGNNTYEGAVDANLATTRSPRDGGAAVYAISVTATPPTQTTWSLVATPVGSMAGDRCGQLTLDDTGRRGVVNGSGVGADACWR